MEIPIDQTTGMGRKANGELCFTYTAIEAANLLDMSAKTLWTITKDRKIGHVRDGRRVKYTPADLRDYLQKFHVRAA